MTTVNKKEIVKRMHNIIGKNYTKGEVADIYEAFQSVLLEALKNQEKVKIDHVCTIETRVREARMWRTPKAEGLKMVPRSGSLRIVTSSHLKNFFKGE